MDVTVKTEKTYAVAMTESQATDLLNVAATYESWLKAFPDTEVTDDKISQRDTLSALRMTLLNAGVMLAEPKPEDAD